MPPKKPKKPTREIKGEVEGYSTEITEFPGGRGSRGLKIENAWHNIIGYEDYLDLLPKNHPPGSFVKFEDAQNRKGYWDVVEGTIKKITRQECYNEPLEEEPQEPTPVEKIEDIPAENNEQMKNQKVRSKLDYNLDMDNLIVKISGFKSDDELLGFMKKIKNAN